MKSMKAKEVLKLLKITRPTLCRYLKTGKIKGIVLPNRTYEYNSEDVFKLLDKELIRRTVIYCRVSTQKQKQDLQNQKESLLQFCTAKGIQVSDVYMDIGSGINFDRKEFQRLLNDIIQHKIDRVIISYKDRLSRISYKMFEKLFSDFHCEILVVSDVDDEKLVEKEIFNEIIGLIHCFSMKIYSSRRKKKLELIKEDLELEDDSKS